MAHAGCVFTFSFSVRALVLSAASLLAIAAADPVLGQNQNQSQVETVVVTGTLLHQETPSPVTVITKEQIEKFNVEIFGSIKNLFDAGPSVDPADYAGVNYNPTFAQDGIIGRFFSIGVRVAY
jgi:outer membrane receptor protein involved in Fe transport